MPLRKGSSDTKSSDACIYCGDYVPPTSKTLLSKNLPPKSKIKSKNVAKKPLSARNPKHKTVDNNKPKPYPIKGRRAEKRKQRNQMKVPITAGNKRCVEAPISGPGQGDDIVMNSTLGATPMESELSLRATPMESELSLMLGGIYLGLMLRYELDMDAGKVSPITWEQYQKLKNAMLFPCNAAQKTQTMTENPEKQSKPDIALSEKPSLEVHASGISAVIESPPKSREVFLGWGYQPEVQNKAIEQTERVEEAAASNLGGNLISIQEDDPTMKPEEDSAQKLDVRPNSKESQMQYEDCQPQSAEKH